MKCLMRYEWVKLPRKHLPEGKGIMGAWARLASRAAFRKGESTYCGYRNAVDAGMWAGGVVGLKSILHVSSRQKALESLNTLSELEFIEFELNQKTKKLTYQMKGWVVKCSGKECMNGTVYATDGYGFLCMPRNITERLVSKNHIFEEADAWLDLWCHTVSAEPNNAFSFLAPTIQYGKYGAILTLEELGRRWNWEKTKVWRFFKKYRDVFELRRLPGSFGCLVFNTHYPDGDEIQVPDENAILRVLDEIRAAGIKIRKQGSDHEHIKRLTAYFSYRLVNREVKEQATENRVALLNPYYIRAYLSHMNCKNSNKDCLGKYIWKRAGLEIQSIRGPCVTVDLTKIMKEWFIDESG